MAERKVRFRHCINCGNDVYTHAVQEGPVLEVRCSACGFPIEVKAPGAMATEGTECIAVVDRDRHILTFITTVLKERRLAQDVLTSESGADLLALCIERLSAGQPLGLVVIGTMPPHLDGPSTALALRAVERGLRRLEPTPIVFVYPAWIEDPLRGLISLCQPALYLTRESNPEDSRLDQRIERAVTHLLGQRTT